MQGPDSLLMETGTEQCGSVHLMEALYFTTVKLWKEKKMDSLAILP